MGKKTNENLKLENAHQLLDRIPQQISVSPSDSDFSEYYIEDPEENIMETSDFSRIGAPRDVFIAKKSCVNTDSMSSSSMQNVVDRRSLFGALSFCGHVESLELGRRCHALVTKTGLDRDKFVVTSLIDMYAKCGDIESANMLFHQLGYSDIASCNSLISGYARNGLFDQALNFFMQVESIGIRPNHYTYSIMLSVCGTTLAIKEGKQLHAHVLKMQYLPKAAVGNALLTMYSKCGLMKEVEFLFERLPIRNIISWTAIITGFYQHKCFEKALKHFYFMRDSGIEPNEYTFVVALASSGSMKHLSNGRGLHAQAIKKGMVSGVFVGTAIIDLYSGFGEISDAEKQFKEMGRIASDVSWNALIAGFVRNEKTKEAMEAFHTMLRDDIACNEFTYSIILKACSSLPSLSSCEQIHSRIIKAKCESNIHIGSSLIEVYAKCGSLEDAEHVFNRLSAPDVVSWNTMIKAYSQHGCPRKAISLFRKMIREGKKPTSATFLAVLSAYSHSGLVGEGQEFFKSMVREYSITLEETHYSCMVDILGRSGQLESAQDFITSLPIRPTASIWRPLLAACRSHGNLQMAEFVAKHILDMDPRDPTAYITLSNIYAEVGRWDDAEEQRKLMELREVKKEPGCSWIEVNKKLYKFFSRDKTHIETANIYEKLEELMRQMKDMGYIPDTNLVLHQGVGHSNVGQILHHSEKLAVCFGLISLPAGRPIRVFKNLRVCGDCHSAMKVVAHVVIIGDTPVMDALASSHLRS
ncbi:hypothetical protein HHK36_016360 [Tetracentron sinense]|uniref:DYW domain-containing protein n=1 Tax=Tetracentron sinense TaxID=13715 RepID=A0A835DAX4_TETSI|nr:hypothetical protein HHK36_016360 [Tetracentron sinense]